MMKSASSTGGSSGGDDDDDAGQKMRKEVVDVVEVVPHRQVLLPFFLRATEILNRHGCRRHRRRLEEEDGDGVVTRGTSTTTNKTLARHREELLRIQTETLSEVVDEYNGNQNTNGNDADGAAPVPVISLEMAQMALRNLGAGGASSRTAVNDEGEEGKDGDMGEAMEAMNEAARLAYVRSVLSYQLHVDEIEEEKEREEQDTAGGGTSSSASSAEGFFSRLFFGSSDQPSSSSSSTPAAKESAAAARNIEMNYDDITEYCALGTISVQLPQVRKYLAEAATTGTGGGRGGRLQFLLPEEEEEEGRGNNKEDDDGEWGRKRLSTSKTSTPEQRLMHVQGLLLRAVLTSNSYGGGTHDVYELRAASSDPTGVVFRSVQKILQKQATSSGIGGGVGAAFQETGGMEDGAKISETFDSYMTTLRGALADVASSPQVMDQLSDVNDGGCTRVVAVTYSEKTSAGGTSDCPCHPPGNTNAALPPPPSHDVMEQQKERAQRQNLAMAQKSASLEQSILNELHSLSTDERKKVLEEARQCHDDFFKKISSIPPGPQRILFMREMDEEKQRSLLVHKLWSSREGGEHE